MQEVREVLEQMVKAVVDRPEHVDVNLVEGEGTRVVFEVYVIKSDRGKVIGKRGILADAMREWLKAACGARGKRPILEIIED